MQSRQPPLVCVSLGALFICCLSLLFGATQLCAQQGGQKAGEQVLAKLTPKEGDYVVDNFHFKSGETLAELRLHYTTFGTPHRDANGHTTNAVLIMHGTGGSGGSLINWVFAGVLFGPGQLLDANRYYLILPDGIGHGKSSKPSDGMHAHFPRYDYDDMVAAQHELVQKGLGVDHLRLVMGTSMGCMHSWIWAETYPDYMDAVMPLACYPVAIAGRNRMWRKMVIDGIQNDPAWKNGEYTQEPRVAAEIDADISIIAGSAPFQLQKSYPTRDAADQYLEDAKKRYEGDFDANDALYALSASRNYDPSPRLEEIVAFVMWINSADDFINPPELAIAEPSIQRVKRGRFVLLTDFSQTHGHGTHTWAAVWQQYLKELLDSSTPHTSR
jgi:homoserine O-acetyltransferase/O-succinyltransferase